MSCYSGNRGAKALLAFSILVLVQLGLVIGLLVLGIKGKQEIGKEREHVIPYYVGAILVGSVFIVPVLQIIAVILLSSFEKECCTNHCFVVSSVVFTFFGILSCVVGMIFVVVFGILNCRNDHEDFDETETGHCSYDTNIDTNFAIAAVALMLILFMLITSCFSFYTVSKYSDAIVSRKDLSVSSQDSSVSTPSNSVHSDFNRGPNQGANTNLYTQGQAQSWPSQYPVPTDPPLYSAHNGGYTDPTYPVPTAPPPYSAHSGGYSNPAYPPNSGLTSVEDTEDPPPSYESVMYGSGTHELLQHAL